MFSSAMKSLRNLYSSMIKARLQAGKSKAPDMPRKSLFSKKLKPWIDKELATHMYRARQSKKYNSSKYMPHQGKQECARRVRNGDIYACNSHGGVVVR